MKKQNLNLGIVGLGSRGPGFIPLIRSLPNCTLVALCDRRKPKLDYALSCANDPDIKGYLDFGEFLKHPAIDTVCIFIDPDKQVDLAVQAMEAGKHVTTEVPACYTIEDCWRLVLTVEHTGMKYQLAEQTRYWGFIQAWRKLVQLGILGKILYVEGEYVGFYNDLYWFQDPETGHRFSPAQSRGNPKAQKTWRHIQHPIGYLPHELSPMLSVLDDRVVRVVGMSTRRQSYSYEEVEQSDVEVALMHTQKDTVLRMMTGFTSPVGKRGETTHHFYQVRGTKGAVEWKRAGWDKPKMWLHDFQMTDWSGMSWSTAVVGAPPEAVASGHGGADYYPMAAFLEAIREESTPPMDVYKSVETAAPAILAGKSIDQGNMPYDVPDFRPGPGRKAGQSPPPRP